jgi:anti-sigma B factor antagonist
VGRLGIETEIGDLFGTVTLTGELDIAGSAEAERTIAELEAEVPGSLIFDLRGLEFMDSTGLRLIVSADARARERGRRIVIVRGPETVQRVFRMTALEQRLAFVDDPADVAQDPETPP